MIEELRLDRDVIDKIKGHLFKKGHEITNLTEFEDLGIDMETALEYLRIIEYCQCEAPIV